MLRSRAKGESPHWLGARHPPTQQYEGAPWAWMPQKLCFSMLYYIILWTLFGRGEGISQLPPPPASLDSPLPGPYSDGYKCQPQQQAWGKQLGCNSWTPAWRIEMVAVVSLPHSPKVFTANGTQDQPNTCHLVLVGLISKGLLRILA